MKNDTPITEYIFAGWLNSHPAKRSHAKLERELNQAIAERDELLGALSLLIDLPDERSIHDYSDDELLIWQNVVLLREKLKEPKTTNVETRP